MKKTLPQAWYVILLALLFTISCSKNPAEEHPYFNS